MSTRCIANYETGKHCWEEDEGACKSGYCCLCGWNRHDVEETRRRMELGQKLVAASKLKGLCDPQPAPPTQYTVVCYKPHYRCFNCCESLLKELEELGGERFCDRCIREHGRKALTELAVGNTGAPPVVKGNPGLVDALRKTFEAAGKAPATPLVYNVYVGADDPKLVGSFEVGPHLDPREQGDGIARFEPKTEPLAFLDEDLLCDDAD